MKLALPPTLLQPNGQKYDFEISALQTATPVAQSAAFDFHTVTWQADGFGFDATTGEFFTASPTALVVMQALSDGLARHQILERLTSTFEVTRSTAERDLESFLAELAHLGLADDSAV
ncbi:PqqD family protein [Prosthecobacter sp.]|uniref:PqqD family protein n=1 Tax=Prosthecobacter sp. TaxID=1965333 RepID=UPI002AB83BDC|nr:PqqD family protein [Prosthecobacter sp.]MDZ4401694.1 PqqD family protein [Prosthecobacter sp.]